MEHLSGGEFQNNQTTKQDMRQEYYCFLVELLYFYLNQ